MRVSDYLLHVSCTCGIPGCTCSNVPQDVYFFVSFSCLLMCKKMSRNEININFISPQGGSKITQCLCNYGHHFIYHVIAEMLMNFKKTFDFNWILGMDGTTI